MSLINEYKAKKGLIRVRLRLSDDGRITWIRITGDFFMYPEEALLMLEKSLTGVKFSRGDVSRVIHEFFSSGVKVPFVTEEDFVEAIMGAHHES
ncbi:lipoate protein ligase C-terminal domain-containing protein [Vulcanisaeta souniana]|uniref:lipoate--protein ligase n=1 Tax=Vulcanisaeta souniana JCM 11219 TaxID=1293586 RepID=A0A830E409_9CREN|nr:lipoate protein ligase C-terminal domain-containing protein [Vulcanisaeta souniana]BDR90987.1 lipoate--protein ligase [Vulcanisaeta souniana JCM 11219]GGI79828.1 lipoate--protein ligase [Vulcanisaeta souniana JCM 11219]